MKMKLENLQTQKVSQDYEYSSHTLFYHERLNKRLNFNFKTFANDAF